MSEHVTDDTGKINDGDMSSIKLMQVSFAEVDPSPVNSPLITVVIWKS